MNLLSPISFFTLFCLVKLFSVIEISHILILFPDCRRQRCNRLEVKENEENSENIHLFFNVSPNVPF